MSQCRQCRANYEITSTDLAFYEKVSPEYGGKKYTLPPPTLCPDCRQQRRLMWRNEHTLYRRDCGLCGKSVISMYAPEAPLVIYCPACWWSDNWDAHSFGREVDFTRPFFEQVKELQRVVPRMALNVLSNENSDYVNWSGFNKNCYLIYAAEYDEDCLYGTEIIKSVGCVDTFNCFESQYCYEVTDTEKCHTLFFSHNCSNCDSGAFLFDCKGCSDCILCTNLRTKKHCIRNKQYTPEDYAKVKQQIFDDIAGGGLSSLLEEFRQIESSSIHRAQEVVNSENVTGDYLKNSHNLRHCFDVSYGDDCAYVYTGFQIKDLMDVCHTTQAEFGYEGISFGYGSYGSICTQGSWNSKYMLFSDSAHSSEHLFGCVCMKSAKYCVLNKKYSKTDYDTLVPKIIEHMRKSGEYGEFFPASVAPYCYDETNAQLHYPLTAAEAKKRGLQWRGSTGDSPQAKKVIPAAELPAAIADTPDDILSWAIECETTKRPFKLVQQELDFYRNMKLPIPHLHPDERHRRRMMQRNPRKLWDRACAKCSALISTTYAPGRLETVYCESCYLAAVY